MILDGYTEWSEVDGDHFAFRPLTRFDRSSLGAALADMPEALGERIERRIVASRIVYSHFNFDEFDDRQFELLRHLTLGIGRTEQEIEDEKNLFDGVRLLAQYPHFRRIDCDYCRKWHINPVQGTRIIQHYSDRTQPRPEDSKLLCEVGECPRGHWWRPVALSPKNSLAYRHYETFWKALPQDSIVLKNARIIENALNVPRKNSAVDGRRAGRGGTARREHRHAAPSRG